jgi:hypothetical protein
MSVPNPMVYVGLAAVCRARPLVYMVHKPLTGATAESLAANFSNAVHRRLPSCYHFNLHFATDTTLDAPSRMCEVACL